LNKLGLQVTRQKFPTGVNIIGTQKGKKPETIIVGCHYDSVRTTPGADDNASGCAMTLDVARKLKGKKLNHTIKYVFFDNEEMGMFGSRYYARNMESTCDFMINFDMVGNLKLQDNPDTVVDGLFKKYPWAKAITFRQGAGPSDHAPFQRKGIPFVWVFTGTHNRYHRTTDTPESLNYEGMGMISQYAMALILGIDGKTIDYDIILSLPILGERH